MYVELNYIFALLSIAVVLFILYGPWQALMTDWARQNLFEIRDEVFDLAYNEKISFDDENYKTIRKSIESSIRFAHDFTWLSFVALIKTYKASEVEQKSDLLKAINNIEDDKLQTTLNRYRREVALHYLALMVLRSPLLLLFSFVLLPMVYLMYKVETSKLSKLADCVQQEAELGDALEHGALV